MTNFKKTIPHNTLQTLSPKHCNSAVTTGCLEKTDIVIFRKEEWLKVFIHETFHSFGMDFANYSTPKFETEMKNIFPLDIEFNVYEAYSECWATIINSMLFSYDLLKDKSDFKNFYLYTQFNLQFEQIFSMFQMIKILNYMGLHYTNLYIKDPINQSSRTYLYKEKTNVFMYYILKTILLYNYHSFVELCKNMNLNIMRFYRSPATLLKFSNFIKQVYADDEFLNNLSNMRDFFNTLHNDTNIKNKDKLFKTLRMTVIN